MTTAQAVTPERAVAACTSAVQAHASAGAAWQDAVHYTVRSLIDRLAATRGLAKTGLLYPAVAAAESALDELGPLTHWHILDLGEVHQRLLELTPHRNDDGTVTARRADLGRRAPQGAWYTPAEVAAAMCSLAFGQQLAQLAQDPDPAAILDLCVLDPACGAGVFCLEAARLISVRLAARVSGAESAPPEHVRAALPVVMQDCIYGVDIDPVAVDLTRAALWLEVDGRAPFTFMNRNVIVGNPLEDDLPPAYRDRYAHTTSAPTPKELTL